MTIHSFAPAARKSVLLILVMGICGWTAVAQSGRRSPPPAPAPTPTPEETPSPTPAVSNKKSGLRVSVGIDKNLTSVNVPLNFYSVVLESCANRLDNSVDVEVVSQSINRGDAVKRAKSETDEFVVYLELSIDSMRSSNAVGYDDIVISYTVFAPTTSKIVTSGNSYPAANRKGPLVVPGTSSGNNVMYAEQLLKRAGEETADRILRALHVGQIPHP